MLTFLSVTEMGISAITNNKREKESPWKLPLLMSIFLNHESSWEWLRIGDLKRKTESVFVAAQDQALNTNSVNKDIYCTASTNKCCLCNEWKILSIL